MANLKSRAQIIDQILKKLEPRIARAFAEGISQIRDRITLKSISDAIEAGRIDTALRIVTEEVVKQAFITFNRELQAALQEGGDLAGRWAKQDSNFTYGMNIADSNTARFLATYQATKIQQITEDFRRLTTEVIRSGTIAGENPLKVARRVKEGLGLTTHQEGQVQNYRRLLEELDSRALERRLRDGRFDPTVARAIREGKALSAEQIDKLVSRYTQRYIKRRSETIARTEAIRMLSMGQKSFWDQAVSDGSVERTRLKRFWIPTYDSKLREAHAAIPRMNKDGVDLDQPFSSPLGMINFPGDPSASAANTINCRCATFTRIMD